MFGNVLIKYELQAWNLLPKGTTNQELCPLFAAARFVLMEHIEQICNVLPRFHQVKYVYSYIYIYL